MRLFLSFAFITTFIFPFNIQPKESEKKSDKNALIIKYDKELDNVIAENTKVEMIAEGFDWSEGPLWIDKQKMLLFSDVPRNTIYKWTEAKGVEVYLKPSGYTGSVPSKCKEPGSNGLTLDVAGNLILCQHGNRQIARMNNSLQKPSPDFITLANKFEGKRFSSPNDCVCNNKDEIFFTDPPYGLFTQDDRDSAKETTFNGVYKIKKDGKVVLLIDSISRPNGLAFFPGQKKLLVANTDSRKAIWYIYDVACDALVNGKVFYDASGHDKSWRGLPDGLKINRKGYVFASGPGGIYIFNSAGKKLGLIHFDEATSNCALSKDEKTLYITNDMFVQRVKLK
ncbi:MAG: SMP-30/gluconolactonase/LRE family protein [Ferruginibacter sp.]